MDRIRVGIVGVSGYSGIELARLAAAHPGLHLSFVTSDRWAGSFLGEHIPLTSDAAALRCVPQADGLHRLGQAALVFLCTPPEVSLDIAPKALTAGARVVDLSGGFRLAAEDYPRWYGFTHPRPDLLAEAVYSMPETGYPADRATVRRARLVANPGCYPTAATLALLPLIRGGVIERDGIVVDAKSGTTGAGRKATEELSFSEVDGDIRAYKVLKHQHTPEIERALALGGAPGARVLFTPHLLAVRRGILATAYGRLRPGKSGADAAAAVAAFAEGRPFLRAVAPEKVTLHGVTGTNRALIGADADVERGIAVGFVSIDNLVKGASGQAVQNANLMLGLPEATGLDGLSGSA